MTSGGKRKSPYGFGDIVIRAGCHDPAGAANLTLPSSHSCGRVDRRIDSRYPFHRDRIPELKETLVHQSHPEIVKRLKRAEGHLRRVIAMVEEGRACIDLAQQLHAVEKAVGEAKKTLIHDHLDHRLDAAANGRGGSTRAIVSEFKAISKYL
jgi:DNA-binding FrmR family transcriptional regulator